MLTPPNGRNEAPQDIPFAPFNVNFALPAFLPLMTGMSEASGKSSATCLEINHAWTTFISQRLREDVALVHRLAHCSDAPQVFGVYSDFFQKALADYQYRFGEMMKLGQMCFAEAISLAKESAAAAQVGQTSPTDASPH